MTAADLALVDVRIRTLDPERPTATALAVKDGVVVAVGDAADVRDVCDGTTRVLSGAGWHVTPGIVDGHQHLLMGAQVARGASFDRVATLDDVRAVLRAERARIGPGEWLRGYAFEYAALEGREFHHTLVDEAAGPGPMLVNSLDMHTAFANAEALRIAGVTGSRDFPDGAFVVVDDAGRPTGELREMSAIRTVWDAVPEPSQADKLGWYAEAIRAQNAVGITGIHQMDGGRETIEALEALEAEGLLGLRVCLHSWVDPADDEDALADIVARRDLSGARWSAAAVKFMLDGVIDTGTAWLEEPDTHGDGTDPMWPDVEHFRRTLRRFHDTGFRIATHAIGDRAVREVLDAYATFPGSAGRHRIEHVEAAPPATVARFAAEGVAASMQPIHLRWIGAEMVDPWSQRLGAHRCRHAMPSGDIGASGATVVLGSDWPVAPFDPRLGLFAAQRRFAPDVEDRRPIGASRPLTGLEALTGYTLEAARVDGGDGGVLRVGAPADLVAWGDDPALCSPEDVVDLPVLLTVVGGDVVHRAE
ncbi:MAG: amidohydrolase [Actinobacteria bacterium]|nr:amidohydrolase [Actinomycetota bacterium]